MSPGSLPEPTPRFTFFPLYIPVLLDGERTVMRRTSVPDAFHTYEALCSAEMCGASALSTLCNGRRPKRELSPEVERSGWPTGVSRDRT